MTEELIPDDMPEWMRPGARCAWAAGCEAEAGYIIATHSGPHRRPYCQEHHRRAVYDIIHVRGSLTCAAYSLKAVREDWRRDPTRWPRELPRK